MRNGTIPWIAVCCAAALFCACRAKPTPTGTVAGKVLLRGQPVAGSVQFLSPKLGAGSCANLDASGAYKLEAPIPVGEYLIAIIPSAPPPHEVEQGTPGTSTYILPKYHAPTTSGLTATVKEGANVADFDLTEPTSGLPPSRHGGSTTRAILAKH